MRERRKERRIEGRDFRRYSYYHTISIIYKNSSALWSFDKACSYNCTKISNQNKLLDQSYIHCVQWANVIAEISF